MLVCRLHIIHDPSLLFVVSHPIQSTPLVCSPWRPILGWSQKRVLPLGFGIAERHDRLRAECSLGFAVALKLPQLASYPRSPGIQARTISVGFDNPSWYRCCLAWREPDAVPAVRLPLPQHLRLPA